MRLNWPPRALSLITKFALTCLWMHPVFKLLNFSLPDTFRPAMFPRPWQTRAWALHRIALIRCCSRCGIQRPAQPFLIKAWLDNPVEVILSFTNERSPKLRPRLRSQHYSSRMHCWTNSWRAKRYLTSTNFNNSYHNKLRIFNSRHLLHTFKSNLSHHHPRCNLKWLLPPHLHSTLMRCSRSYVLPSKRTWKPLSKSSKIPSPPHLPTRATQINPPQLPQALLSAPQPSNPPRSPNRAPHPQSVLRNIIVRTNDLCRCTVALLVLIEGTSSTSFCITLP